MSQSNTSASRHRATKACPTPMIHYDDTQDVSMRPRGYNPADQDTVIARHLQIKATMERHKDALLDKLQDPTLTPEERSRIEAAKNGGAQRTTSGCDASTTGRNTGNFERTLSATCLI